jgi:hypothetical protein
MSEALAIARFLKTDNVYEFFRLEKTLDKKSYTKTPALNVGVEL